MITEDDWKIILASLEHARLRLMRNNDLDSVQHIQGVIGRVNGEIDEIRTRQR